MSRRLKGALIALATFLVVLAIGAVIKSQAYSDPKEMVDYTFWFIAGVSGIMLLAIVGFMVYVLVRYNHRRGPATNKTEGNFWLEFTWIVIPTWGVLVMFWLGYRGFKLMRNPPADALNVKVKAHMWYWEFEYPNKVKSNVLEVPVNRPVKLTMRSGDVIHSFYIAAFRVKEDVLPDRETYLWFQPHQLGEYDIQCAEYCGMGHSLMRTKLEVVSADSFSTWLAQKELALAKNNSAPTLAEK